MHTHTYTQETMYIIIIYMYIIMVKQLVVTQHRNKLREINAWVARGGRAYQKVVQQQGRIPVDGGGIAYHT